jgi:hypothetical protein
VAYLKPGENCSLGVCSLPSVRPAAALAGPAAALAGPPATQRLRRQRAAADLAASLAEPACDCGESCCTAAPTSADPLLRQVLTVIGSQLDGERLSTRTEESVPNAHQQLASMAAPNGGRVQPHKEER